MSQTSASTPDGWQIDAREDGTEQLLKSFKFADFVQALAFVNAIGELAEAHDHHPEITLTWGKVRVCWWSHDTGGISDRDYKLAELCNQAAA